MSKNKWMWVIAVLSFTWFQLEAGIIDSLGFISPVDHQIRLTGNFMELRPNHFHAGIDIKSTNGQSGDKIKSVHNGYISRIKIQSGSYGNALYIDHDNGYTSVYAHLSAFAPEIEAYVTEVQYAVESFEVDIYLPDSLFRLSQGQKIGEMGNTGRSFGPHLHFELRKTEQEMPVNPESLGIGPSDNIPPTLESIHMHTIGEQGEVLDKEVRYFKNKGPEYELHSNTWTVDASEVGLGLQMYDRMDGSWNKNGIYGYQVKVDNQVVFSWKADRFTFDETRYINAFWDYERQKSHGQKVYLMYKQSCNPFSYFDNHGTGVINISDGVARRIEIIVTDLHKNHSTVSFNLVGAHTVSTSQDLIACDTIFTNKAGKYTVKFEENAFYSPIDLKISSVSKKIDGKDYPAVSIGNTNISVNGYYSITCPIPKNELDQYTMVSWDSRGRLIHFGGDTINGQYVAKVDQLGTFALYKDQQPPKIELISFDKSMKSAWKFRIKDQLTADGHARGLSYHATLDGSWLRFRYDEKNDLLIFDDFNRISPNPKQFRLEVWDHNLNRSVLQRTL